MVSLYDAFADSCTALAARTKRQSDKFRLEQLAKQWRSVAADQQREAVRIPFTVTEPTAPAPFAKPAAKLSKPLRRWQRKKKT
jgi:hypothetical protein